MWDSVLKGFRKFNEPFEGCIPYMYLDVKGLVTIGVGNLIDPVALALTLPFVRKAPPNDLATQTEIAMEWGLIKGAGYLAHLGAKAFGLHTFLMLKDEGIDTLVLASLTKMETYLKLQHWFRDFDTWPADAQMALLSMSWAVGPGKLLTFHRFCIACSTQDFIGAASECRINTVDNPGVIPRNDANRILLMNAHFGRINRHDPSELIYPQNFHSFLPTMDVVPPIS